MLSRLLKIFDFVLQRLLIVLLFVILIIYSSREISDLDLWLHLKTGEVIVKQYTVPLGDIFSFTMRWKPWINHEWLFQVIAYLFYAKFKADGLILMQNLILVATFIFLFFMGVRRKNYILLFIILYMALLAVSYRFMIRPDIFSLFFLTFYLFLLKSYTESPRRFIWLLPFTQVLWNNMHGFSFTGPLLVVLFLIGEFFKYTLPLPYAWNNVQRLPKKQILELFFILLVMLLTTLLNPHGLKGALYPMSVLGQITGEGKIIFQYIQELAKPITLQNFSDVHHFMYYKALIVLSLFSFRFNQKHINVSHILLWLSFLMFSLLAIRNVAYFVIVATYVTFCNYEHAMDNGKEIPLRFPSRAIQWLSRYAFIAFLFYFPTKGALRYFESTTFNFDTYQLKSALWGIAEERYPKKAVQFLLKHPFPAHMFNDFNSGSYLIGQAFPKRRVFIDGRTELYGPEFFKDYVAFGEGKKDVLEKIIARYDIKGFFLTNSADDLHPQMLKYLFLNPEWKVVYFDEFAIIFLKNTPENSSLIKQLDIDLKNWAPPKVDFLKIGIASRYPWPNVQRAQLLNTLGCYRAAAREAKVCLEIMPHNAEALKFMADFYFDQKDYLTAYKYVRNCLIFSQGDLRMRSQLALIYHHLKEDQKALKVIDAVIKKRPKYPHGYYVKAMILKEKDRKTTKELLKKAIKISPKEPKYHEALGDFYKEAAKLGLAKKEWQAALEYDSANEALKKKIAEL